MAGIHTVSGRIALIGTPYTEMQHGEDGFDRLVLMFPIRPIPENGVKKSGMFVFKDMEDYKGEARTLMPITMLARGEDQEGGEDPV